MESTSSGGGGGGGALLFDPTGSGGAGGGSHYNAAEAHSHPKCHTYIPDHLAGDDDYRKFWLTGGQ